MRWTSYFLLSRHFFNLIVMTDCSWLCARDKRDDRNYWKQSKLNVTGKAEDHTFIIFLETFFWCPTAVIYDRTKDFKKFFYSLASNFTQKERIGKNSTAIRLFLKQARSQKRISRRHCESRTIYKNYVKWHSHHGKAFILQFENLIHHQRKFVSKHSAAEVCKMFHNDNFLLYNSLISIYLTSITISYYSSRQKIIFFALTNNAPSH